MTGRTIKTTTREWLEARIWPNAPVCPNCGSIGDDVTAMEGKAHRPGVYQRNGCREQFTATVKTVFKRSKIPLSNWLAALFLLTSSKKGVSAHLVHRSLGISYKSSWFMMHRMREAMKSTCTVYLSEFDFRYNTRTALRFKDLTRAEAAAAGINGRRLTYRRLANAQSRAH